MKLTHFLRAVSALILLLFVKTNHAQLDYIGHFNNVTMGGSAWVKAGTLAIPQAGFNATITFYGGTGFNAQTSQNAQVEVNIRTSNGGSLADGAYPVSAVATIFGENTGFANIIRLVPNVPGVTPASYDVYFSTGSYVGVGYYRVTSVSGITWTHAMVQATPPAGYNVRLEFRTQTDTWLARNALFASAATGNVGIGTLTPDEKLTVNGTVRAKKVKVTQTGWPDYVFDSAYVLPSLQLTADFIKQHKHLPGVTPAAEVEKQGLDIGATQAQLLEKIEQLTLYLIEQEKKLAAQQSRIDELEKKIK